MVEGQSRYGIMESLNSKKIDAQKRLSEVEQAISNQEMVFKNNALRLKKEITDMDNSYVATHENWVENKEHELKNRKLQWQVERQLSQETFNREVEDLEHNIKVEKKTYTSKHKKWMDAKEVQVESHDKDYEAWVSSQNMRAESITKEIAGYENALNDLKEVSKESVKKD